MHAHAGRASANRVCIRPHSGMRTRRSTKMHSGKKGLIGVREEILAPSAGKPFLHCFFCLRGPLSPCSPPDGAARCFFHSLCQACLPPSAARRVSGGMLDFIGSASGALSFTELPGDKPRSGWNLSALPPFTSSPSRVSKSLGLSRDRCIYLLHDRDCA